MGKGGRGEIQEAAEGAGEAVPLQVLIGCFLTCKGH